MKKLTPPVLILIASVFTYTLNAQAPVKPNHVIIIMEENYAYSEIIGSASAPTLTALSRTSYTANFTQDFAITHPSEPNYLELFSDSNQGVTADETGPDSHAPFNNCNMGSSLIQHGYTFTGYSEGQPSVGWISGDNGEYVTKHCPWINWIGYNTHPDTIPLKSDQPYTAFPDSSNYSTLPTVSWVIPNEDDDMHDPSTPSTAISNGDAWFKTNMMPLVRWASHPANKTIVITVWDEDDGNHGNNIPLLVSGAMVNGGNYSQTLNHYNLTRTIEDMYGLTDCFASRSVADWPSTMWDTSATAGVNSVTGIANRVITWPVPAKDELNVKITSSAECITNIRIYDLTGRMVKEMPAELKSGENIFTINTGDISNGFYFLKITGDKINVCSKIAIAK